MLKNFFGSNLELNKEIVSLYPVMRYAFWITLFVTGLSLASVVYMMQVYDRVVSTRSMETLLSLTIAVILAYLVGELLEVIRKRLITKACKSLEDSLSERIFRAIHRATLMKVPNIHSQQIKDLGAIREFLSSPAMMTLLELPTAILFILLIFMINTQMGLFSLVGLLVQIIVAVINATKVNPRLRKAQGSAFEAMYYAYEIMRNAQIMQALGMAHNMEKLWLNKQKKVLAEQAVASDIAGLVTSSSKFISLAQGSLLLGFGCWLSLQGHMSGGGSMMIVASIIGGKALQPIAQLLGSWRMVSETKIAYERLGHLLTVIPKPPQQMYLPAPEGQLSVENLVMAAPGFNVPILRGVSFNLPKGSTLLMMGPSGSGKSTLTRALMGVWPSHSGKVRLDGVDVYGWSKDDLGPYVGYLPQDVDLFDGTVAENIARFGEVNLEHIQDICKIVGIHDVIEKLPNGYHSNIGDEGVTLSGGQKQRVGLARAIYRYPRYIIMDEPNSNLDRAGEIALMDVIRYMKSKGATQIIVSHRTTLLPVSDYLLLMRNGLVQRFGLRDEVLLASKKAKEEHDQRLAQIQKSQGT